jgi:hypothetical protein
METIYVKMGIRRQTKLKYIRQLFCLVDPRESQFENIIEMKYDLPDKKMSDIPELILNIKWSLGLDFVFVKKDELTNGYVTLYLFNKKKSSDVRWVDGRNFNEGIDNLWKRLSTDVITVNHYNDYYTCVWNSRKKLFEFLSD